MKKERKTSFIFLNVELPHFTSAANFQTKGRLVSDLNHNFETNNLEYEAKH